MTPPYSIVKALEEARFGFALSRDLTGFKVILTYPALMYSRVTLRAFLNSILRINSFVVVFVFGFPFMAARPSLENLEDFHVTTKALLGDTTYHLSR